MSEQIDTEALRQCASLSDIDILCDEIDRLRREVEAMKNLTNKDLKAISELNEKIEKRDEELATIRDRLRPRSIKDEPPPKGEIVWATMAPSDFHKVFFQPMEGAWFRIRGQSQDNIDGWTHWLPMPPAPTKPDKFEEWMHGFNNTLVAEKNMMPNWDHCRKAWTACKETYGIKD